MKKLLLCLAILFSALSIHAAERLKPVAALIKKYEDRQAAFIPFRLIQQNSSLAVSQEILQTVSKATVVSINETELQRLVKNGAETITISIPYEGKNIRLNLARVTIFTDDFSIETNEGEFRGYHPGIHYRGIIDGDYHSIAAFSFFDNQLYGMISNSTDGNIVIGKMKNAGNTNNYIVYSGRNLINPPGVHCSTEATTAEARPANSQVSASAMTTKCVRMYYEVDYDIYQVTGSTVYDVVNYLTWLHNNVSVLYYNDSISTSLSGIFVWTVPDPYTSTDHSIQLNTFQSTRTSFNGDVAQLFAQDAGSLGGLAYLDGLCSADRYAYANTQLFFSVVPMYSDVIEVLTHEFGHLLGSPHTHACVWNGNNTAIDNCGPTAGYGYEGFCSGAPTPPLGGGTIMSYCHLVSGVLIDFANGFGPQPALLIQNTINAAPCLTTCNPPCASAPPNNSCTSPTPLTVGVSCNYVSGELCRATASNNNVTCAGENAPRALDVWYSFTAASTGVIINCLSGTNTDVVLELDSGTCANPGTIACVNVNYMGGLETMQVIGLVPGTTYLIRVYDYNGNVSGTDFQLCAMNYTCIAPNDLCSAATALTIGTTCNYIDGELCNATQSISPMNCAATESAAFDVWYKITPNQQNVIIECQSGVNTDIVLGIYQDDCPSPTYAGCTDVSGFGGYEGLNVTGFSIGVTYLIRVYDYNGNALGTDFQICARYNCSTTGDTCVSANPLPVGSTCNYVAGELCGATQSISPATCSGFQPPAGRDVWYTVVPAQNGIIINCQPGTETDPVIGLYEGNCASLSLIQCTDLATSGGLETLNVSGISAGSTYYVRVYDFNGNADSTNFWICARNCTPVVPSVFITNNTSTTICAGTNVTFTASPVNGGSTPLYTWKKNGVTVGTGLTYSSTSLANNDTIKCILTSAAFCATPSTATSNSIIMTVNPTVIPDITISSSDDTICSGTAVQFGAFALNGGPGPSYQWTKNGVNVGASLFYITTTLVNNDVIKCILIAGGNCASPTTDTSNAITMKVYPMVTPGVSIVATPSGAICPGTSVTFTPTPVNGGLTPSYLWLKNGVGIATGSTYSTSTLVSGDTISCTMTSSENCLVTASGTSNKIGTLINTPVTPGVSITATQTGAVCGGTNITFTPIPVNGGASPAYQWIKNGINVATGPNYSTTGLSGSDTISCVMTSNESCTTVSTATSNELILNYKSASSTAGASVVVNPPTICSQPQQSATLKLLGGTLGSNANWYWYSNSCGSLLINTGDSISVSPAVTTTYFVRAIDSTGICAATSCISGIVTDSNPEVPLVTNSLVTLQCTNYTTGLQWYFNGDTLHGATAATHTATQDGTYFVIYTDPVSGCYSQSADILLSVFVGLTELTGSSSISVFPNPAYDILNIRADDLKNDRYKITLTNALGQHVREIDVEVKNKSIHEDLNIGDLAAGIYLLTIQSESVQEIIKIEKF